MLYWLSWHDVIFYQYRHKKIILCWWLIPQKGFQVRYQNILNHLKFHDHKNLKLILYQSNRTADPVEERTRFQIELEFVQCLANPNYLNFLAQRKYLQSPQFVAYLRYLQYWRQPEYAKYLRYPMCLYFLDLLQYEHFRKEISSSHAAKFIEDQQLLHWQHYIRKRSRMLNEAAASRQQRQQQQQQTPQQQQQSQQITQSHQSHIQLQPPQNQNWNLSQLFIIDDWPVCELVHPARRRSPRNPQKSF